MVLLVVVMVRLVVVGVLVVCGNGIVLGRVVVEPVGAPARVRVMLVGSPVVVDPAARLTVTV